MTLARAVAAARETLLILQELERAPVDPSEGPIDVMKLVDVDPPKTLARKTLGNPANHSIYFRLPSGVTVRRAEVNHGILDWSRGGSSGNFRYTPPQDRSIVNDIVAVECSDGQNRAVFVFIRD